jgi:c-di-GMP-related signal transduction protein
MATPMPAKHRFIGRQAILDRKMGLYGYELLFRTASGDTFPGDVEDATSQTIDSCLSMIACSSPTNLFVNCTREALVNQTVMLLPSSTVVLEVLETVTPDAEVVKACKKLKQSGFRLALDDFSPDEDKRELVKIADYIKVDFRSSDAAVRREIYDMCRDSKPIFLAEKVETLSEVQTAQAEGNTLFQGYYYSRPEVITEAQISASKSAYLQLLAGLAEPSLNMKKIERLLLMEPSLCFRLLRLANSAAYGSRFRISTIQAALLAVGEDAFRKLVTVVLASMPSNGTVDRDVEQALQRAYFCESLAPVLDERPAELYMLGMLSMMDRMLNVPMKQLLDLISVDSRIQEALLGSAEGIGRALSLCRYHENGGACKGLPCEDVLLRNSASNYFEALLAAGSILRALHA